MINISNDGKNVNIKHEDVEDLITKHIEEMELKSKLENEIIKNGAMDCILENLLSIKIEEQQFLYDDHFLYCNDDDKKLLGKKIYIIVSRIIDYIDKYKITYDFKKDSYVLFRHGLFSYKNNIFYVKEICAQGTCYGIYLLNKYKMKNLNINDIGDFIVVDYNDVINDKPLVCNNPIYKAMINKSIDAKICDLVKEFGEQALKERFEFIFNGGPTDEKNN